MRDNLCIEEKRREGIKYKEEFIKENREEIKELKEDIKNGIQRNPNDNESIIAETYLTNFLYYMEKIRAKYSIGEEVETIEDDFVNAISDLENIGKNRWGI